jgi:hypothetical protein
LKRKERKMFILNYLRLACFANFLRSLREYKLLIHALIESGLPVGHLIGFTRQF